MEAFLVVADEVLRELTAKGEKTVSRLLVELKLIKEMTGKLSNHKIEKRWGKLLGEVKWSGEEAAENDIYIRSVKHKNSSNYLALYDY
jgi:hypothetical protein